MMSFCDRLMKENTDVGTCMPAEVFFDVDPAPAPVALGVEPPIPASGSAGASSSAGPALAAEQQLAAEDSRGCSVAVVLANGGIIRHYHYGNRRQYFEAQCPCDHFKCRKSMSSLPPTPAGQLHNPTQGRCLGYLLAWLTVGATATAKSTRSDHMHWEPSHEERRRCRDEFKRDMSANAVSLRSRERPKDHPDDDSEPEVGPQRPGRFTGM